ncbi:MAG: hypothetical protein R2769_17505 [Saprospiraceae bacterium]
MTSQFVDGKVAYVKKAEYSTGDVFLGDLDENFYPNGPGTWTFAKPKLSYIKVSKVIGIMENQFLIMRNMK